MFIDRDNNVVASQFSAGGVREISDHYNLQNRVLSTLPIDQDWIHVRSSNDWDDVHRADDKKIIGVHDSSGKLVAHSVALLPHEGSPDADMLNMNLPDAPENLTTLTTVMTDPNARGQGLMTRMLRQWMDVAVERDRPHLLALITTNNTMCWTQFIASGLEIVGVDYDHSDGSNAYHAHRDLRESFNVKTGENVESHTPRFTGETRVLTPDTPLEKMRNIFSQGWVGTHAQRNEFGRYTGNLILSLKNS